MKDLLLNVKNLKTYFYTEDGVVKAVDGLNFKLRKGETLGIVGESGSGKSVTSLSLIRLIASPPGKIVDGEIIFKGKDLLKLNEEEIRRIRGNEISMIFQEPMTSLNPVFTVGDQINEALILHQNMNKKEATKKSIEMLELVGIPSPNQRVREYPHQLSGGMRQRVMIAMALACNPSLLIADEPTTALDVTIEAQILELMKELKDRLETSIMLITHDLGVVAEVSDSVLVMYAGEAVEYSKVDKLFEKPLHPYSEGLIGSMPDIDVKKDKLETIEGIVPSLFDMPTGCFFNPRCKYAKEICKNKHPEMYEVEGRQVRCLRYTPEYKEEKKNE